MIRIGVNSEQVINNNESTGIYLKGSLYFEGSAYLGKGTRIKIEEGATLIVGDLLKITGNTSIVCYKSIEIGRKCMMSWDILVMDSDTHKIFDESKRRVNEDKPVRIGENVWIGCRNTILKGSIIPDNSILAAGTVMTGQKELSPSTIIAGNPPSSIKPILKWTE